MAQSNGPQSIATRTAGRVTPLAGFAAHIGRGFRRLVTDTVVGGRRAFPRSVGDLDAQA